MANENQPDDEAAYFDDVQPSYAPDETVVAFDFVRGQKPGPIPSPILAIESRADGIASIVRDRFSDHRDRDIWLDQTLRQAHLGAVGPAPAPNLAVLGFEKIEKSILRAARPLRRAYILDLFWSFATIFTVSMILYLAFGELLGGLDDKPLLVIEGHTILTLSKPFSAEVINLLRAQFATVAGLSLGIQFSGVVQNRIISLTSLEHFDPDGFSTPERMIYVWVVATTLEVLIYFDVLTVGIGGRSFDDVTTDPSIGLLIGLATALAAESVAGLVRTNAVVAAKKQE